MYDTQCCTIHRVDHRIAFDTDPATPATGDRRALAKEPKDRFQNMDDFGKQLRLVLQEIDAGAGAGYQSVTPEPPRHLAGANPVFARGALA